MKRNGKIARLPDDVREELNLRLDNNEGGPPLLDWLNALPEARKIVAGVFDGVPISKQNLNEWRQGGYKEWAIRNELSSRAFEISENVQEMEQAFHVPLLAGSLATVLAAQYAKVLAEWDGKPNAKTEAKLHMLRIFCRDIALLQRTMYRATRHSNEFHQKLADEEKQEIEEMKEKALAPIMAFLEEKVYASTAGESEVLRRIGAVMAAIDNNQPVPKFDETPDGSQTESNRVKPLKKIKPVKPEPEK